MTSVQPSTDSSIITAYANDFDFSGVFARQVQALGRAGDVLIGISTSGRAANVIAAVRHARELGMRTVALTAQQGELASLVDVAIRVPSATTAHIQEAHLAAEHTICHLLERLLV